MELEELKSEIDLIKERNERVNEFVAGEPILMLRLVMSTKEVLTVILY